MSDLEMHELLDSEPTSTNPSTSSSSFIAAAAAAAVSRSAASAVSSHCLSPSATVSSIGPPQSTCVVQGLTYLNLAKSSLLTSAVTSTMSSISPPQSSCVVQGLTYLNLAKSSPLTSAVTSTLSSISPPQSSCVVQGLTYLNLAKSSPLTSAVTSTMSSISPPQSSCVVQGLTYLNLAKSSPLTSAVTSTMSSISPPQSSCVVQGLTYLNITSASTTDVSCSAVTAATAAMSDISTATSVTSATSATSATSVTASADYLSPLVSARPALQVKLPSYPCQPGPSTIPYPRQVSSSSSSTSTASTEPVYYLAEPPASPIYCDPQPPPSPTHIYRELDVSGRNRMNKSLKYSLWCIVLLLITAIIVGSLLYVYIPHKDIDDCKNIPCANNGTCVDHEDGPHRFTCQCAAGYSGDTCQIDTMTEPTTKPETTTELDTMTVQYNSTPSLVFGGRGSEPGRLQHPRGVVVHHLTDVIYVADQDNHRVCEFNSSGHVTSCMAGYITDDNITVDFNYPYDISVMTDGRMVISDDYRVIVTYSNMTVIHVWGSLTRGRGLGQFNWPRAVASDGDLIYVADTYNHRIQVLNVISTGDIEVIEVTAGDPSVLYQPWGIAVDRASGYILVTGWRWSDDGSRISIMITYYMTGHYVRHVTPSDLGVDQTRLGHIALYRDQVYVSDWYNHCIHILSYTGSSIQRLGHRGTCHGCFRSPYGVAVHSETGHLIVTDWVNHNVQIFRPL